MLCPITGGSTAQPSPHKGSPAGDGGAFFNMRPSAGQKHAMGQSIYVFRLPLRPRRLAQGSVALDHHRPGARTVAKGQA
jgi:hypothetical protein